LIVESRGGPARTGGSADSATVVVTHVVAAGREDDYKPWQQRTIEAARGFDGFEGAEVYPPSSAGSREWVVVYRFATIDQLTVWTQSEVRRRLLDEGRSFFDTPPTRDVLVGKPPPPGVVTLVTHDVLPGMEQEYVRWQDSLTKAQKRFPGFMGGELFKPVPGVQDRWVLLFRFDTPEHLGAWLESDTRTKLLQEGRRYLRSYDLHTVNSPFSGWFGFGGGAGAAIPRWKQAMAVLLALYPTVVVLAHTTGPLFKALHVTGSLAMFVSLVLSTIILTWILMPVVNRALAFWLMPRGANPARAGLIGTAVVVLCYVLLVVAFTVAFA
jgi:antibiotic biosynthesis monooxygenase (ABM) superfamily enzyme